MDLYKIGSDRSRAELIAGPVLGTMAGLFVGFRYDQTLGVIAGLAVAALVTALILISWTKENRRRDRDSGGGDGGGYEGGPAFDGSSTRHFDANHRDSDGGWGDGGDGGGGDGGGGGGGGD